MCAILLAAHAGEWLATGDVQARSDVELLADSGFLATPTLTWPVPWRALASDLIHADTKRMGPAQFAAWSRLITRYRTTHHCTPHPSLGLRYRGGSRPLRWYRAAARAREMLALAADGICGPLAYRIEAQGVHDADNLGTETQSDVWFDGSYAGFDLGNWFLSAGKIDRWWGPGGSGNLLLTNNARPVPGIALTRLAATPFPVPVLELLGPWRLNLFAGQLESERAAPRAKLIAMRLTFRPLQFLQFGLSRSILFGGQGQLGGFKNFVKAFLVKKGPREADGGRSLIGDQRAGYDVRINFHLAGQPFALYGQAIAEDHNHLVLKKYIGNFGLETWGALGNGGASYRGFLEYADTAADMFSLAGSRFNLAYENFQYKNGYRYLGSAIGYPTDNDSRLVSLGFSAFDNGDALTLLLRGDVLNRDGTNVPPQAATPSPPGARFSAMPSSIGLLHCPSAV
jgi:hypothetical protein